MKNRLGVSAVLTNILTAILFVGFTGAMIYLTVECFNEDILGSFVESGNIIVALFGILVDAVAKVFCIVFVIAAFFGVCAFTALSILRFMFLKFDNRKASFGVSIASVIVDGFIILIFLSSLRGIIYILMGDDYLNGFSIACIALAAAAFVSATVNFALSIAGIVKYNKDKYSVKN